MDVVQSLGNLGVAAPKRANFIPIERPKMTVEDLITEFGLGKFQVKMFFLCGLCWTADAMEILLIEFLSKEVAKEFHITDDNFSALVSGMVFLGMFVGAFFWGFFSDRFGRLKSYSISSLFVGVFGMLAAASPNVTWLMIFRFLVGFGFGGSHTAYTLWLEFTPIDNRGKMLQLNQIFWTLGALIEVLLAWLVLEKHGWRLLVVLSSIMPFFLAAMYWMLPESPRFLVVKGRHEEAGQVLRDVARANGKDFPENCVLVLPESHQVDTGDFTAKYLVHPTLISTTLCLFLIWAADTFSYYGSAFITPKFFEDNSLYTASLLTTCSEIPGIFLPMLALDTIGRKATLSILLSTAAIFFFVLAFVPDSTVVLVSLCIARMCMSSAFTVTFIYTSEVYPTIIRSTGLGSASAIARLAGFATNFVATGMSKRTSGIIYGVIPLVAAIAAIFLPYETSKRPVFDTIAQMEDYDADQENFHNYRKETVLSDTFEGHNERHRGKDKQLLRKAVKYNEGLRNRLDGDTNDQGSEKLSLLGNQEEDDMLQE